MKASLQTPGLYFYSFHQALRSSRSVFTTVAALHFKTEDEYFAMNSDMDGETLGGISMWIHLQHIYRVFFYMLLLNMITLKLTVDKYRLIQKYLI